MIECPECFAKFAGKSCKCGYKPRQYGQNEELERKRMLHTQEAHLTLDARRWLQWHAGIKETLTGKDRRIAIADYRKRLGETPRVAETEPRLWAVQIMSRINAGEILPAICKRLALEALGEAWAEVEV